MHGEHNVLNSLAAIAITYEMGLSESIIRKGLKEFKGVERRFTKTGVANSITIIDDYGHHPVEIKASLKTAKEVWPSSRLIVIFQPHRYSRTKLLMKDFWSAFNDADYLFVMDIFSAGEIPLGRLHANDIVEGARECGHKNAKYIKNKNELNKQLDRLIKPGDVLMTLGAGDVWNLGRDFLVARFSEKK